MNRGEVWAVTMVRDEADVIASTLTHIGNEGVDGIIVADNMSVDDTGDLLADAAHSLPCRVVRLVDPEPAYYQSRKMTRLAAQAADMGAEWVIPFDADEVWYAHEDRLANVLRSQPSGVRIVEATIWNHFVTCLDEPDPVPFRSMVWRHRSRAPLTKVAFRWSPDVVVAQGNHAACFTDSPSGVSTPQHVGTVALRHFPYRSFNQFVKKAENGAAAYAATDLPADQGAHWRQYGQLLERHGVDALREVWDTYYRFLSPTDADLVHDPAPFCRW